MVTPSMSRRGWIPLVVGAWILFSAQPVLSQLRLVPEAATTVYDQIPDFPKENHYQVIAENVGAAEDNTLVYRMMLYHMQVKGRSPINRLDWKLTLADYLELNEPVFARAYPGASILSDNPYRADRDVLKSLNRQQRNQLLEIIITAFDGDPTPPILYIPPATVATPTPQFTQPGTITIPPRGGADLLK